MIQQQPGHVHISVVARAHQRCLAFRVLRKLLLRHRVHVSPHLIQQKPHDFCPTILRGHMQRCTPQTVERPQRLVHPPRVRPCVRAGTRLSNALSECFLPKLHPCQRRVNKPVQKRSKSTQNESKLAFKPHLFFSVGVRLQELTESCLRVFEDHLGL